MKFSLVLATVDRVTELERFLLHLNKQTYQVFELIIADQNSDDRLLPLISNYGKKYPITHIRLTKRGAAHARNQGLKRVTGDIIAFPDDDCWYPHDLLAEVKKMLCDNDVDGITGRTADTDNNSTTISHWTSKSTQVNIYKVWTSAIAVTMFYRPKTEHNISFDESLGVGANTPWGSAEETDYFISMIKSGYRIVYHPSIVVYHLEPIVNYGEKTLTRTKNYSAGIGRVLKKNDYPLWFFLYHCSRPIGGMLLSFLVLNTKKSKYHWVNLRARIKGWTSKFDDNN